MGMTFKNGISAQAFFVLTKNIFYKQDGNWLSYFNILTRNLPKFRLPCIHKLTFLLCSLNVLLIIDVRQEYCGQMLRQFLYTGHPTYLI